MTINHVIGVCLFLSGMVTLIHHAMLRANPRTWPPFGGFPLTGVFVMGSIVLAMGLKLFGTHGYHSLAFAVVSVIMALYALNSLLNTVVQGKMLVHRRLALDKLRKAGFYTFDDSSHSPPVLRL